MENKYPIEIALAHYGIKGMRWGIRKDRQSADRVEVSALMRKKPYELSDAELKKIANRLTLEQNYRRLNPSTMDKGKAAVDKLLSGPFKNVANKTVEKAVDTAAQKIISYAASGNASKNLKDAKSVTVNAIDLLKNK